MHFFLLQGYDQEVMCVILVFTSHYYRQSAVVGPHALREEIENTVFMGDSEDGKEII